MIGYINMALVKRKSMGKLAQSIVFKASRLPSTRCSNHCSGNRKEKIDTTKLKFIKGIIFASQLGVAKLMEQQSNRKTEHL